MPLDDFLHTLLPCDDQQLPGLAPAVRQYAVFKVAFLQIYHVDEGHTPCVEAEQEEVAC